MDWVAWVFFESPAALGAALGVALFVLLVVWRRTGRPRPLLVGVGLSAALFTLQYFVVTPRECAGRVLDRVQRAIVRARPEELAPLLAGEFAADGFDAGAFVELVRERMQRVRVHALDRQSLVIESADAGRIVAVASYLADVDVDAFRGPMLSTWEFTLTPGGGDWRIARLACRRLSGQERPSLRAMQGM